MRERVTRMEAAVAIGMKMLEQKREEATAVLLIMMMMTMRMRKGGRMEVREGRSGGCVQLVEPVGHHQKSRRRGSLSQRFSTRMEVPSVLLSTAIWRVVRGNLAGGAKRGLEVEAGERVCGQGGSLSKIHDFIHLRI